ncbi:hypothetical protein [Hymenobacter jeollabukensis]|uniref:Lipocalin-like domain-containing protein n=1 Tax=Hymenobacter jeollabukensis TaxID=2025313 RepID=A0A5R8WV91_9BACT|nr:hypothetical protein [Hymenobacter jeollabukensis]TLM95346.1 hypothetical protein FDY95_06035 [Hymenobacter jeollabukensis]
MKRATVFAALSLLAAFACEKDNEQPLSTTELLLARAWRITAATARVNGRTATDVFRPRADCVKDNTYRFGNSNEVVTDEGLLKCATADAQSTTGRWTLADSTLSVTNATATRNYSFTGVIRTIDRTTLLLVTTQRADTVTTITKTTFTAQ